MPPHFNDEGLLLEVLEELTGDRTDAEVMGKEECWFGAVGDLVGIRALCVQVELEPAVETLCGCGYEGRGVINRMGGLVPF